MAYSRLLLVSVICYFTAWYKMASAPLPACSASTEGLRRTAAGCLQDLPQCGTNLAATDAVLMVQALLATEPAPDAVITAASKAAAAAVVSRFLEAAGLQALLKVQLAMSGLTTLHQQTCQCCSCSLSSAAFHATCGASVLLSIALCSTVAPRPNSSSSAYVMSDS